MIATVPATVAQRSAEPRDKLTVSIITPAYNPGPDLAAATVASLNAQTRRDFEWILIDDCSTPDHTAAIDQAFSSAKFPVTLLRHACNERQGQARNTGLAHARAPFIKFLDADDALDPRHIEKLVDAARALKGTRSLAFAPTRHLFLTRGTVVENHSYRDLGGDRDDQLARLLYAPFLSHCGALFPRALIENLGGYDPSLVTDEDGDLLLRVLLAGWTLHPAADVYYIYRHRDQARRVSRDDTPEKMTARMAVGERVLAHFAARDEQVPDQIRAALCHRFDALAVRNWRSWRDQASACLDLARALDTGYAWSGSRLEQAIRRIAGITNAQRVICALRAAKGVSFH